MPNDKYQDRVPDLYDQRPDLKEMSYKMPKVDAEMMKAKKALSDGLTAQQEETKRKRGKYY